MATRSQLGAGVLLASMCLLGAPAASAGDPPAAPVVDVPGDPVAPSTRRMAALLDEIIRNGDYRFDPFSHSQWAKHYLQASRRSQGFDKLNYWHRAAQELLLSGDTIGAVEEIERIDALLAEQKFLASPAYELALRETRAIAYLRLGEQRNCILNHGNWSCIVPIQGPGIHTDQEGSRLAIQELTRILKDRPSSLIDRWLLNLAAMTVGEYPEGVRPDWRIPPEVFDSEYALPRFTDIAPDLGVDVIGLAGGTIMDDFDGDGFFDLMTSSSGLLDPLRMFRNEGDGTFTDVTAAAGLTGLVGGLNLVHADYDNDGSPDVFVLRGAWLGKGGHHPNSLLHNRGDGTFEDTTEAAGVLSFHPTQTAAWGDYDGDGWVDLFVGNETEGDGHHPCELFRNNGDGTFTDVAERLGLTIDGFVKAVIWGDYNNDGRPDLFVSQLGARNSLFRNDGPRVREKAGESPAPPGLDWVFTDVASTAGVSDFIESFPIWFFDYDNDGWEDLLVAGFQYSTLDDIPASYLGLPHGAGRPHLYHNLGDGTFADVTRETGMDRVLLVMGSNFGDLDNDGWLDVYFGTGAPDFRTLLPNRMFRNDRGRYFQDVTTAGGFGNVQKGHGISFGDLDQDGDQDIYQCLGGSHSGDRYQNALYENPGNGNHWIALELEGTRTNRAALGARIAIRVRGPGVDRTLYRHVTAGGSFGASPFRQHIGLGPRAGAVDVTVSWPVSGLVETFEAVAPDAAYLLREGDGELRRIELRPFPFAAHPPGAAGQEHFH